MATKKYHEGFVTYFKRGNRWHAYWSDKRTGKQTFRALDCSTQRMARVRAKEILEALEGGTVNRLDSVYENRSTKFANVMKSYLKVTTWSPSTLDRNRSRIKRINERWGDQAIATITAYDIGTYLQEIVEKRSIATRNRYLAVLRKVFPFAYENALIPLDPTAGLKQLKEPEKRIEALTPAQFGRVMNVLPPYAQIIMGILHDTGMRAGELHSLRWRHIRSSDRQIVVENPKNSELRLIPMTDYVYDTFEELRQGLQFEQTQKGHSRATIFWPSDKDPNAIVIPTIDINKSLATAAKKVGLPKLTRHMMRHTFATYLGANGATDMDLMDLGGWKSVTMVRRYRKAVNTRLADVIDVFNQRELSSTLVPEDG
jgi:integrase